ncbi:hypothetical protein [Leptospira ryugenii]|uniref:hypothetical protein n=1 Tax=Leptospira ryugenii TaxID=1917863 RepID=UPI000D59B50F|nr:hypothetical protein [Leptospira ryugenii]
MTGAIWIVQLVHYPSMRFISEERFVDFHHFHTTWISPVVAPMMLLQLGSSFFLAERKFLYIGLSLLVFLVTFAISVPLHNQLSHGYKLETIDRLVETNWYRTVLWSAHSVLLAWELWTKN